MNHNFKDVFVQQDSGIVATLLSPIDEVIPHLVIPDDPPVE